MQEFWNDLQIMFTTYLPNVLLALGLLIVGWIVAILLSSLTRRLLHNTTLDDRLGRLITGDPNRRAENIQAERWISTIVFWLIMLFAIVAFFQTLNIPAVSIPLNNFLLEVVRYIPAILGAAVLVVIAWLVATILRAVVVRVLNASGFVRTISTDVDMRPQDRISISQTIGNVIYWLVFLLFLPAILDALNLRGLLAPVQGLVDEILAVLPNILAAGIILLIGWFVARIVRQIVTNLLAGLGIDRLSERTGVSGALGQLQLSNVIGTIVYILILIPVAIAALNALNIPAVSQPASEMLTSLLNALPAIFGALLLIGIAYYVGRLVGQFVAGILANIGFDRLFVWLGVTEEPTVLRPPGAPPVVTTPTDEYMEPVTARGMTPSQVAGYLVTVAIILFAAMEAADMLGFETLTLLISDFLVAASRVLVGLFVFALGLYFANLADRLIRSSAGANRNILATGARVAILIFAGALALREMGIAESIVNLAFGLLLGAVAVAIALAFGLGGREAAARQLERWNQQLRGGTGPGRIVPPTGGPTPSEPINPDEPLGY